ncbi:MAG: hypothetical protein ACXIUB_03515 [Wenzhouxiangella sp.]
MIFGLFIAACVVGGFFYYDNYRSLDERQDTRLAHPDDQRQFINLILQYREDFRNAPNEMTAGGMRPGRGTSICRHFGDVFHFRDWTGTLTQAGTNSEGRGVLSVKIDSNITLKIFNNAISDAQYGSLIDPSSPLFEQAASLNRGEPVTFSGSFFPARYPSQPVDCVVETSMTLRGSMQSPEFLVKFESIHRLNNRP